MAHGKEGFKYPRVVEGGPVSAINARALEAYLGEADVWHVPTLQNSWVDYSPSGYQGARYRRTREGIVHIQGLIKSGTVTAGTVIFTLPEGYRPTHSLIFATITNPDVFARLTVGANGQVTTGTGCNNTFYSINCSFST